MSGALGSDEGPTVAAAAPQTNKRNESPNSQAAPKRLTGHATSASQSRRHEAAPTRQDQLRGCIKCVIVTAACWGFPASWAQWLIQRGGLCNA